MADQGNMKEDNNLRKLRVAMFPWLAYGHIMPFLQVSVMLAENGHRISFISTPKNLHNLPSLVPRGLSDLITFVELPLPRVDGLPESAESTSELPIQLVPYLKKAYDSLRPSLAELLRDSGPFDWIIQDFVSHWLPEIASPLGIDVAMFSIFNATFVAFIGPLSIGVIAGRSLSNPEELTTAPDWFDYPTTVRFTVHEVMSHSKCMNSELSDFDRFAMLLRTVKFLAVRSCREFEAEAIGVLDRLITIPTVPVGLLPPKVLNHGERDDYNAGEPWAKLRSWLNDQKEKSVIYVALGTEVTIEPRMIHEFARGLEESRLPFVWVVKNRPLVEGSGGSGLIPPGYEDRVGGRGFIWYGWAPQLEILSHSSVGGFLTHCGWSSTIEALGCGRALVLFSGANSDQGFMARLLQEKGVGIEIPRDEMDGSFTSDAVAETIRRVMVDEGGEEIRAKAWASREVFSSIDLQKRYANELIRALEYKVSPLESKEATVATATAE